MTTPYNKNELWLYLELIGALSFNSCTPIGQHILQLGQGYFSMYYIWLVRVNALT